MIDTLVDIDELGGLCRVEESAQLSSASSRWQIESRWCGSPSPTGLAKERVIRLGSSEIGYSGIRNIGRSDLMS